MTQGVAILVPVLNRPARVSETIRTVREATAGPHRLLFIANEGDTAELAELERTGADFIVVPAARISWACKINDGFAVTDEPWVFTAADDLRFHPEWFERALRWADEDTRVIGTNDICNHRVMSGQHSTHTLFRRDYVERFGTIDQPGLVMHEGYRHDYVDDEAIATAKARGVYAHAFDAIVEHMHPLNGKAADDATYRKGRQASAQGRRTFTQRKVLWADEQIVRLAMVPPPERAIVVTATYGSYDADLHVPVPQDIPTRWVCFTDNPSLVVREPWEVVVAESRWPDDPRMSAKVPKIQPWAMGLDCDDVVWMDASHEVTSPSFVREALASRRDGIAAFTHPRRDCVYAELQALLGSENQNGLYFSRPLKEQGTAYHAEGHPGHAGLFACGTLAWDLRHPKVRELGEMWLAETERWSHQDQVEFPVVCRRLGIQPGSFPLPQIDTKASRNRPYLCNRWQRIHPHVVKPVALPASVLIPFASDDPDRIANLAEVRRRYQSAGYEVVVGTCDEPWSKGAALADAFRQASHDVLIVADADCIIEDGQLAKSVQAVTNGAPWAVPHRRVCRLGKQSTQRVLSGARPRPQGTTTQAIIGGGLVVVSREAWQTVGGVDPRFLGWGGEDGAFAFALSTLCGPYVPGTANLFHLYHPPELKKESRPGGHENSLLHSRYRDANGDVEAMRALVDEVRVTA